jgi:hypothetical protein
MTDFLKRKVGNQLNVFAYDWRQSNFASACDLVRYIDKRKNRADAASGEGGITLVTHSMGGIVGRLFISYRAPAGTAGIVRRSSTWPGSGVTRSSKASPAGRNKA